MSFLDIFQTQAVSFDIKAEYPKSLAIPLIIASNNMGNHNKKACNIMASFNSIVRE